MEAVLNSVGVAYGKTLEDGRFQQVLPNEFFFKNIDEWKNYVKEVYGDECTFTTELTVNMLKETPTWHCMYCEKGKETTHIECLRKSKHILAFMKNRVWSDPRVQQLYKYKSS